MLFEDAAKPFLYPACGIMQAGAGAAPGGALQYGVRRQIWFPNITAMADREGFYADSFNDRPDAYLSEVTPSYPSERSSQRNCAEAAPIATQFLR
jgi:hypothetical protein